jgi:hypothetical protein
MCAICPIQAGGSIGSHSLFTVPNLRAQGGHAGVDLGQHPAGSPALWGQDDAARIPFRRAGTGFQRISPPEFLRCADR